MVFHSLDLHAMHVYHVYAGPAAKSVQKQNLPCLIMLEMVLTTPSTVLAQCDAHRVVVDRPTATQVSKVKAGGRRHKV